MDPVTIGAVLLAIVSGAGTQLGAQLWEGVVSLVRRPFRRKRRRAVRGRGCAFGRGGAGGVAAGPGRPAQGGRAGGGAAGPGAPTSEFGQALQQWWAQPSRSGPASATSRTRSAAAPSTGRCCRAGTSPTSPSARHPPPPAPPEGPGVGLMTGGDDAGDQQHRQRRHPARPGAGPGLSRRHLQYRSGGCGAGGAGAAARAGGGVHRPGGRAGRR